MAVLSVCCCFPLRFGGIFLGFLFLLCSLFSASLTGVVLYDVLLGKPDTIEPEVKGATDLKTDENFAMDHLPKIIYLLAHSLVTVVCSLFLLYGSLSVSATAFGWSGVNIDRMVLYFILQRRKQFLIPHLFSEAIRFVSLALFCAQQIYYALDPPLGPSGEEFSNAAVAAAIIYFILFRE